MDDAVKTVNFNAPEWDIGEIKRYAGVKGASTEISALINECVNESEDKLSYSVCYAEFPVSVERNKISFSFADFQSSDLSKNLNGADRAVIFCASVGVGIDRLIEKYKRLSPAKALIFQAIGAERVESLCNAFNGLVKASATRDGKCVKPRFSAGYGDFSLSAQKDIFAVLEPSKHIGVCLNDSLLMSPSKSVTAIIGITDKACEEVKNCSACDFKDCAFRG